MNYKKPKRMFEDSGTVDPKMSYHVELENVTNTKRQDIKTLVDLCRYFSIFAPRQSGKTTYFEDFCHKLKKNQLIYRFFSVFRTTKSWTRPLFTA